jgi:AAA15 family ATPase/GTPase
MITRLYIDNFLTLVNFEIKFEPLNLLLGDNGSGKTAVFEALRRVRDFIVVAGQTTAELFPAADRTRWQDKSIQTFELDLATDLGSFYYQLAIEHFDDNRKTKVKHESLKLDHTQLFSSDNGEVHLFTDEGRKGPLINLDGTLSGVGLMPKRRVIKKLTAFKKAVEKIVLVNPNPFLMSSESQDEVTRPSWHMENFAAWYRFLSQENIAAVQEIMEELPKSLPGLKALNSIQSGERTKVLKAVFQAQDGKRKQAYSFGELSDGQKMLIAIFALVIGHKDQGACLFIDEPDNYISIAEIQPWLRLIVDDCGPGERLEQVIIISQHPETIDYAALGIPILFKREAESHTRITTLAEEYHGLKPDGMTYSQLLARKEDREPSRER